MKAKKTTSLFSVYIEENQTLENGTNITQKGIEVSISKFDNFSPRRRL